MSAAPGETLSERIAQGSIPLMPALEVAREIAAELEKSHEKGIGHGGLTSANIQVLSEGGVAITGFGTVPADPRTDIPAFGSLTYEMLAGRPAAEAPDWQRLPDATPNRIRLLLERCLSKDPHRRIFDIGDVLLEIDEALHESALQSDESVPQARRSKEKVFAVLAFLFFIATAGLAARLLRGETPAVSTDGPALSTNAVAGPPAIQFDIVPPYNPVLKSTFPPGFYLSPDGQKIAYVTLGAIAAGVPPRVWVRQISSSEALGIASTTTPNIAWSPDSKSIAFFDDRRLKKISAAGGPVDVVCDVPGAGGDILAWGADDVILFGQQGSGPLLKVSASGGKPEPATELDTERREQSHAFPYFLPDGKHFFYVAAGSAGGTNSFSTFIGELGSKQRRLVPGVASEAKYLNGHLLFIQDKALMAQPFDLKRFALEGEPFVVAPAFLAEPGPYGPFSVSSTGILAFTASRTANPFVSKNQLVWFDEKGSTHRIAGATGDYGDAELSPDGKFVAFTRTDTASANTDIWILDVEKGSTGRLTTDPGPDFNPRWAPDSKRIAFSSTRNGGTDLYERAIDAVGSDKLVLKNDQMKMLMDWSADGQYLIYGQGGDIWALPLGKSPIQITNTPFTETNARVSPDGKWIAFVSDEKGESKPPELYIQSFPQPGMKKTVSEGGGVVPRWSRDGKRMFFLGSSSTVGSGSVGPLSDMLMVASVNPASLEIGLPKPLFSTASPNETGGYRVYANYNVTADNRFLVKQNAPVTTAAPATRETGSTTGITLMLNWPGNRR